MSLDPEDQQANGQATVGSSLQQTAVHAHLVETQSRPRLSGTEQAMLRSQSGPMSGVPFAWSNFHGGVLRGLSNAPGNFATLRTSY